MNTIITVVFGAISVACFVGCGVIYFTKLKDVSFAGLGKPRWWDQAVETLQRYPIGTRFEYLGRQCVVVSHTAYDGDIGFDIPEMVYEYTDERGVIRRRCCMWHQVEKVLRAPVSGNGNA